jgi:hypothetical protein
MLRTTNTAVRQLIQQRLIASANKGLFTWQRPATFMVTQPQAAPFNFNRRLFSSSNTSDSEVESDKIMMKRTKSAATREASSTGNHLEDVEAAQAPK